MTKRKYGIDLLRIISMFLVVVLHVLKQGGILANVETGSLNYHFAWIFEIISFCAVNCYGLISGYVNVENKIKYYKIGVMWIQVALYSFIITLLYDLCHEGSLPTADYMSNLYPVCNVTYWYFTAYFALFFVMPFLNVMINNLSKIQLKTLGITIFVLFSVLPTISDVDMFVSKNGYSFLWLAMLYIMGAVIKKLDLAEKIKSRTLWLIAICAVAVSYIFKISADLTNSTINHDLLVNYTSITTVLEAVAFLALAVKNDIKKESSIKFIKFISPLTFGVYIIHTNPWIFRYYINGNGKT